MQQGPFLGLKLSHRWCTVGRSDHSATWDGRSRRIAGLGTRLPPISVGLSESAEPPPICPRERLTADPKSSISRNPGVVARTLVGRLGGGLACSRIKAALCRACRLDVARALERLPGRRGGLMSGTGGSGSECLTADVAQAPNCWSIARMGRGVRSATAGAWGRAVSPGR